MEMKKRAEKEKRVGYRLRILQKKIKTALDCKVMVYIDLIELIGCN